MVISIGGGRNKFLLDGQIMKHVIVPCTTQLMLKGYCIVQLYGGGNIGKFGELSAIRQCFTSPILISAYFLNFVLKRVLELSGFCYICSLNIAETIYQ